MILDILLLSATGRSFAISLILCSFLMALTALAKRRAMIREDLQVGLMAVWMMMMVLVEIVGAVFKFVPDVGVLGLSGMLGCVVACMFTPTPTLKYC